MAKPNVTIKAAWITAVSSIVAVVVGWLLYQFVLPQHRSAASHPYASEIIADLNRLPPFQRADAEKHYEGLKVSWDVSLNSANPAGSDGASLLLLDRGEYPWITCDSIPLADNPELRITKAGAELRVEGIITGVDANMVHLRNCVIKH